MCFVNTQLMGASLRTTEVFYASQYSIITGLLSIFGTAATFRVTLLSC